MFEDQGNHGGHGEHRRGYLYRLVEVEDGLRVVVIMLLTGFGGGRRLCNACHLILRNGQGCLKDCRDDIGRSV